MLSFLAIILTLFCSEIATSRSLTIQYRAGYYYLYNYNGQVASSLSNGNEYSVIRIRSEVSVEFENDNTAVVKLLRPELGKLSNYLESPNIIQPFQKFGALNVKPENERQLVIPFEIQYNNGKVSEIKFSRNDSTWSENIKRSVINLLQVKLQNPSESARLYSDSYFYKVNETTIEGQCETTYHIQRFDDLSNYELSKPTINITKTVDVDKCFQRPELRYNYYRHSEPVDWRNHPKRFQTSENQQMGAIQPVVESISHYEYNINNEIIKSASVFSKYSYDLVDKDHVSLTTTIVGLLEHKNSERKRSSDNDFPKKTAQSLIYSNEFDFLLERFITQANEEYLKQNPYLKAINPVEVVKNILRRLIKSSIEREGPEGIEEDATFQFSNLVSMLRYSSANDIQQIHEKLFNGEYSEKTRQFVKEILADALAAAGTKNTIEHLVKKIENKEITPTKASKTLENLYKLRLTSEQMIKPIWKLCESEISRKNENLKRSCYLAYGAMVNAMCGHSHEHGQEHEKSANNEKICPAMLKQKFINDVMGFYKQCSIKSDKILALKTLGNMGIDDSIDHLEKIIVDKLESRIVRITAIDALRNLRDQIPEKIQLILTPIFRNRREYPEIRMNAFHEILLTRPNSALLHLLCAEMTHETNVDVKSFVVSSIEQLANNADNIADNETATIAKSCITLLEQIDPIFLRQSASKKHEAGFFSSPTNWHELGSLLKFASIFSNDSYLPKELMAGMDLLINERFNPNVWQFGVHMQELEQLVNKVLQNVGNKRFDDIVIRGKRSFSSQYNPFEMLKTLFRKMQIAARRRSVNMAEPMLLFYDRRNNLDYTFYIIDESNLPQIVKKLLEGHLDVSLLEEKSAIIRTNGAMHNFESRIKLPTTIGIPMVISSRMTTIGFIDGKYLLTFGNSEIVRNANIKFEAHPQIASTIVVKMEMFSPLFTSGVKTIHSIQGRLPINLNVEIKSPNLIPTITLITPEKELRLVHIQSRPVIFTREWPQKSNVVIEASEKTQITPELDHLYKTNDFEFISPLTENKFVIQSHYYRSPYSDYDWILSGENAFDFRIKPTQRSAKTIRFGGQKLSLRNSQPQQNLEEIFNLQPSLTQNQEEIRNLQQHIRTASSKPMDLQEISLKLETPDLDKSITIDIKTAYDDHMTMCILDTNIKTDFGSNVWTWKTLGQVAFPELHDVYAPIKSGHIVGKIESSWGSRDKNMVTFNVYGKPSEMKVGQFKKLLNKDVDVSNINDREEILDAKFSELPSKLMPNKYIVAIEYQVSEDTINTIVPIYNWIKILPQASVYIPEYSTVNHGISTKHSSILVLATYDNFLNVTLSTPDEQIELMNSFGKQLHEQKTVFDKFANRYDDFAKCDYKREQIKTFDGKFIAIPLTTCYTILAKDCGYPENPTFAIMAKKLAKNEDNISVKFITRKNVIELYKDISSGEMIVKINNRKITGLEYDGYNIRKIETTGLDFYEIKSQEAQAVLRFNGQKVAIKISDDYVNRQCGICGHMNNDRDDDLLMNGNMQAASVDEFHLSYINRDECDSSLIKQLEQEVEKNRQLMDSKTRYFIEGINEVEKSEQIRDPIKKTIISETRDQICFSIKPVNSCLKGYRYDDKAEKENVEFKCFKRFSSDAKKYILKARERDFEFENDRADMNEKVVVPRRCIKY